MTIQQLEYILDIRKTGSFSRTAQNFCISQAAISQAVNALERELGVAIFQRGRKGVAPTTQGAMILKEADSICAHHHRMVEGLTSGIRHIRISYVPLAPLNQAFVRLYEEFRGDETVRISQRVLDPLQMAKALLLQEVDVCILAPLESFASDFCDKNRELGVDCRVFATLPTAIMISPSHPLYQKPDLSARDFEKEVFIDRGVLSESRVLKTVLDVDASRVLLAEPPDTRRMMVDLGLGYTIGYYAGPPGKNRRIPLDLKYSLIAMTNALQPVLPEVSRFLELASEEVGRELELAGTSVH